MTDGGGLAFRKSRRAQSMNDDETWVEGDHANTLNSFDAGDVRTTHAVLASFYSTGGSQNSFARTDGVSPTLKVGSGLDIASPVAIVSDSYYVEDCENAALRANGANDGPPRTDKHPLVVQEHLIPFDTNFSNQQAPGGNTAATLDTRGQQGVADQMSVRRLTPTECERLMGWPDEWTAPEGVKAPDSKRYAACGDGIVAPVAFWIADRIRMIEGEA